MSEEVKKLGAFPYVIGGLSYIPLIGLFFGVVSIIWGLVTKRKGGRKLALIGTGGICVTLVLYGGLFYFGFVKRGGIYDELRVKLAETTLTSLVQSIEFYRIQNGTFPDSLDTLQKSLPKDSLTFVFDPTDMQLSKKPRYFYYEVVDEAHYYLRGVGLDGKPFTDDDILPKVESNPSGKIGLLNNKM